MDFQRAEHAQKIPTELHKTAGYRDLAPIIFLFAARWGLARVFPMRVAVILDTRKERNMIRITLTAFLGLLMFVPAARAAEQFEVISCYSGTVKPFHDSKELTLVMGWNLDGIFMSRSENKFLDNATVHCEGIWRDMGENRQMHAYCRIIDPDGDMAVVEWKAKGLDAGAEFLEGTGKYKGIKTGYKSEQLARGKPPMKGVFAGCNTLTGTYKMAE
jgi:hypothetical protein